MKLAVHRWNIAEEGSNKPLTYYGYKTKKEAQDFADKWNTSHLTQIHVIDTKNAK